jgi:predicted enzyme related to lactoylglutathione lyase
MVIILGEGWRGFFNWIKVHVDTDRLKKKMKTDDVTIHRIVPNIYSNDPEKSKVFYMEFLGMELVMDMEWILTFASKSNPRAQISVLQHDKKDPLDNKPVFLSIEVDDVDFLYAIAKKVGCKITYPLTNEAWGVRRFFVEDPNGATINILSH